MLQKYVNESGADWNKWIPYLLFAYLEVPQASTGFSPFELLYGQEVQGLLSLLKEIWIGGQVIIKTQQIFSYVLQMREKLKSMTQLAQAHHHQWKNYDQKVKVKSFEDGEKALVMLPSDASNLLAKWQGPFEVVRKLGPTTY